MATCAAGRKNPVSGTLGGVPVAPALAEEGTDPAKVLAVEQADGQGGQDVAPQAESTEVPVSDSGQTWNTGTHTVTA